MVEIVRKQRDFNSDMDAYLDKRKGNAGTSFFKKVDALLNSNKTSEEGVPNIDVTSSTVYGEKKSVWKNIFSRPKRSTADVLEEEIQEAHIKGPEQEELEEIAHEIDDIEDAEDSLEEKRENLLTRFFSTLFGRKKAEPSQEVEEISQEQIQQTVTQEEDALREETKQVLKNIHKWLSKLPPEQIDAFRRSPDFEQYKDVLERYGLVK